MNDAALKASKANGSKVTIVVRLIIENLSTTVSTVMKPNQIYHSNSNKEAKPGTFFLEEMVAAAATNTRSFLGIQPTFERHHMQTKFSKGNFSVS